jgi:hypothetical protein
VEGRTSGSIKIARRDAQAQRCLSPPPSAHVTTAGIVDATFKRRRVRDAPRGGRDYAIVIRVGACKRGEGAHEDGQVVEGEREGGGTQCRQVGLIVKFVERMNVLDLTFHQPPATSKRRREHAYLLGMFGHPSIVQSNNVPIIFTGVWISLLIHLIRSIYFPSTLPPN